MAEISLENLLLLMMPILIDKMFKILKYVIFILIGIQIGFLSALFSFKKIIAIDYGSGEIVERSYILWIGVREDTVSNGLFSSLPPKAKEDCKWRIVKTYWLNSHVDPNKDVFSPTPYGVYSAILILGKCSNAMNKRSAAITKVTFLDILNNKGEKAAINYAWEVLNKVNERIGNCMLQKNEEKH